MKKVRVEKIATHCLSKGKDMALDNSRLTCKLARDHVGEELLIGGDLGGAYCLLHYTPPPSPLPITHHSHLPLPPLPSPLSPLLSPLSSSLFTLSTLSTISTISTLYILSSLHTLYSVQSIHYSISNLSILSSLNYLLSPPLWATVSPLNSLP